MKKTAAALASATLIAGGLYFGLHSSVSPAPTIGIQFTYCHTNLVQWINIFVERTTNLVDWDRVYTFPFHTNLEETNFSFQEERVYDIQLYRVGVSWTNQDEQFRP